MISLSKTRSGKIIARGTGKVTSAPQYRSFETGNTVTTFYINSDTFKNGKEKTFESYKVNAWGDWSDYANALEKGDVISVSGECVRDEYNSKRNGTDEYMINAQEIHLADIGVEVMRLRILVDDLRNKLAGTPNGEKKKKDNDKTKSTEEIDTSGFETVELPDFLKEEFEPEEYETSI
jgi:single-stranded DNA-binding protein